MMADTLEIRQLEQRLVALDLALRTGRRRTRIGALVVLFLVVMVLVYDARTAAQSNARVKGPFEVLDSRGQLVFRVDDDGWTLMNKSGQPVAGAAIDGTQGALMVADVSGPGNFARFAFDGGRPRMELISKSRLVAALGATKEESATLEIFASNGPVVSKSPLVGKEVGGAQRSEAILELGLDDKSGAGLIKVNNSDGKAALMLSAVKIGGRVRVFNENEVAIGGLFASESGGGLALTGPAGGNSAVSLGIGENGGRVRVFPVMGSATQAELSADAAGGAVAIYTKSGAPAALLHTRESGAGRLEIGRGGQVMVEAGVTESGLGIVRAGPVMGGQTGGQVPPWAILGRRER